LCTHADIGKARALLNYQPATPIEVGMRKFVEWFKRGAKS
jgi:nucleoside-diphosphate-sugar epimerase